MRLRIFSLLFVLLLFAFSFFTGEFVEYHIPKVTITKPNTTGYTRSINCPGEIVEQNREDVYLSFPIIASDVRFSIGDYVKKGDIIAVVDKTATATAIISSYNSIINDFMYDAILSLPEAQIEDFMNSYSDSVSLSDSLKSIPDCIVAGISGTLTQITISCNKPTTPYSSIATIIDDNTLVAKVSVKEENIDSITVGASVILTGSAFGEEKYEGSVTKIYPSAYKKRNSLTTETVVDVIVTPNNTNHNLKSGYTTKANIIIDTVDFAITVPYEAVLQDNDNREYVYVLAGSKTEKRYVSTGLELSNGFEILEGINETDLIIVNPLGIEENSYVKVVNYEN